ncbi:type II toxin-antitoxin system Phd/YefM family antitoxin [Candidatus Gottesmanbacteria bacterium]|nr:type II toxin-antitoxin system Phd/YefM family antitoxin [Candidatus Gottesmanbacteria bacterium]
MNYQFVRTTDIQRNFKSILEKLHASNEPVVVLRDSVPEVVMVPYTEYQELSLIKRQLLRTRMDEIWETMRKRNANVSDEEINAVIEQAKRYAKRRR